VTGRLSTRLDRLEREAGAIGGAGGAATHRTAWHAALEEARRSGEAIADPTARRLLDAYQVVRGYLEEGSAWKIPAAVREQGRYVAPVFHVALGLRGTIEPGWSEWDALRATSRGARAATLDRHEAEQCCGWLFLVTVETAEMGWTLLDFHGPMPDSTADPLVPRPGSPRLTVAELRMRAAVDAGLVSGCLPIVVDGAIRSAGNPELLAERIASDPRVTRYGDLDATTAAELARAVIERTIGGSAPCVTH